MAKTKRVTPGREGYKIMFAENTVIMNKKFAAAAAKYGTKENRIIRNIRHDFPGMAEVIVLGRECDKAKPNHRLTYENMEKHIMVYENAEELLNVFDTVKAASAAVASPYKYVCDWFKAQFPNYNKPVVFQNGKLAVRPIDAPKVSDNKQKLDKVG